MTKEELKKEAEEYAEGMAKYYASTHEGFIPSQFEKYLRNACVSSAEPREKRIAELEKENAELKEELKDANKKVVHLACNQNKDLKRKITKAKEIIKYLLSFIQKENYKTRWDINITAAEQFLSEVEK